MTDTEQSFRMEANREAVRRKVFAKREVEIEEFDISEEESERLRIQAEEHLENEQY